MAVFTGNANPQLAQDIARHLMVPLGRARSAASATARSMVEMLENVRGRDVFVLQSTCAADQRQPDGAAGHGRCVRRASAARITAVIPYFGYARQDRRPRSARVPITAKVVANMIAGSGVDRVLTMDLHADQIQGFFDIPVDNVYASPVLLGDVWKQKYHDLIVVSPDVGGVVRARALAKRLDDADLAIIDKRRPRANVSEVMNIIGDVEGRTCVIIDDMVDTAGTLCQAATALKERGREEGARVLHAPGAVGPGGRAHREVGARRAGRDRHDPAARGGEALPEDPPAHGRGPAGRDDAPHQRRGDRELAVHRLSESLIGGPVANWSRSQSARCCWTDGVNTHEDLI